MGAGKLVSCDISAAWTSSTWKIRCTGIWKTKWGYRADLTFKGERIIAKGFFKDKDEARDWIKQEKKRLKENPPKSSSQDKDLSFWSLSQKYLVELNGL